MFKRSVFASIGVTKHLFIRPNVSNIFKRSLSTDNNNNYDIIIVGSGMIGSTLACTLGKNAQLSNKRILLIESNKKSERPLSEQYSNRVVALNCNTIKLLDKIGAWEGIANVRFGIAKQLQVWDGVTGSLISFDYADAEKIATYIVENDLLLASVNKQLENCSNVTTLYEAKIKEYKLPKETLCNDVGVTMESGNNFNCKLLLGCDGANSQVRRAMGTSFVSWNYKETAVVATLHLKDTEDNCIAWQRFLPTGTLAFLPLKSNLSSLVWCTSPEHAKELLQMQPQDFVSALNYHMRKIYANPLSTELSKYFENTLQAMKFAPHTPKPSPPYVESIDENSRASFPLGFGHAVHYVDKGVALVGDAAHRVHPLAGQGVNLGFGDISDLDSILSTNLAAGYPLEHVSALQDYETQRFRHNIPTMIAIDGLQKLYSTEFTPIVLMRSMGLQVVNNLKPLKKAIINHAMS